MNNPVPQPRRGGDYPLPPFFSEKIDACIKTSLRYLLVVVLVATACILWFQHLQQQTPVPDVGIHVIATPAKEVKAIPKHSQPLKNGSVRVYESRAKDKLDLPGVIIDDPFKHVLESTQVKADDHPQTITTVIDSETGESQTFVRRDPLPWIAWDNKGEIGLYAGIKNGQPTTRLEAKQGIFQVKALHFGVIGTVDQPMSGPLQPDYFIGAGAWYRW